MIFDADVHCAVPGIGALLEHLDENWREYATVNGFKQPPALGLTYPTWLPMLATNGSEITVDRVRDEVLSRASALVLTCYYAVESLTHPYLGPAFASAVNRWLATAWLDQDPRFFANAVITPQHLRPALEEIERIGENDRFVGVMLPARSAGAYGQERYWPLLDAIADRGLVLTIGAGGASGAPPTPVNWLGNFFEDHSSGTLGYQAQVMSLVFSGVFERRPDLTVVLAESGWTWLPPLMWRMNQEWKGARREVPWVKEPPSAYVRRHFRLTTQPTDAPDDARVLCEVYEQLGSDEMLLYASDFPHLQGDGIEALRGQLTAAQQRAIEWDNAWSCFGLERRSPAVAVG